MLIDMAKAININPLLFVSPVSGSAEDIIQTFFWLDEDNRNGEITDAEYLEWKLNWLDTCDDCGKYEPKKGWRY